MAAVVQERLVDVEQARVEPVGCRPVGADKTFRSYEPDQVLSMSPVLREWVPEGGLAHFVGDLVDHALGWMRSMRVMTASGAFRPMTRG